jgi:hypothetical protein
MSGHTQVYLNDFHLKNSEACFLDQEQNKSKPLTIEDVIKQSTKQGRLIQKIGE